MVFGPRKVRREGLEVVYRASGLLTAQVIKGRLETSGIPAALDYESLGPTLGVTIDGLGEVRVLVPIDRVEEALELLATEGDETDLEPEDSDE
jgi:hypothetical protein